MNISNLKSNKVTLTKLTTQDVSEDYVSWLNDPQINKFLDVRKKIVTLESQIGYVRKYEDSPTDIMLKISTDIGIFAGVIKIEFEEDFSSGEVGILIGNSDLQNKGLASEALLLAEKVAETNNCFELQAGVNSRNIPSKKLFLRCGYLEYTKIQIVKLDNAEDEQVIRFSKNIVKSL